MFPNHLDEIIFRYHVVLNCKLFRSSIPLNFPNYCASEFTCSDGLRYLKLTITLHVSRIYDGWNFVDETINSSLPQHRLDDNGHERRVNRHQSISLTKHHYLRCVEFQTRRLLVICICWTTLISLRSSNCSHYRDWTESPEAKQHLQFESDDLTRHFTNATLYCLSYCSKNI